MRYQPTPPNSNQAPGSASSTTHLVAALLPHFEVLHLDAAAAVHGDLRAGGARGGKGAGSVVWVAGCARDERSRQRQRGSAAWQHRFHGRRREVDAVQISLPKLLACRARQGMPGCQSNLEVHGKGRPAPGLALPHSRDEFLHGRGCEEAHTCDRSSLCGGGLRHAAHGTCPALGGKEAAVCACRHRQRAASMGGTQQAGGQAIFLYGSPRWPPACAPPPRRIF